MEDTQTKHWYCIKAKIKREHIAARMLRSRANFEVFCPRITITKKTIRGPKPFTEALFPGYLFCRFNFEDSSRLVSFSQDIKGIVRFGDKIPTVPDATLEQLRAALPQETVEVKPPDIQEGELAEIIQGCFQGESGKVIKIEAASDRVNLLIEFLGHQVRIQVPAENLINLKPAQPGVSLGLQATPNG